VATRLQRHFPPCCQRVLARLKKSLVSVPIFLGVLLSAGCTSLPSPESRQASYAPSRAHTKSSSLGQAVGLLAQQHPGLSGIYPLADPKEAFAVRALLADAAEQTLDVQYYIWRNDLTGILLIQHLRQAADRGVRVRLLLDDSANVSFDELLASLDAHENIDVRLFNPLAIRFPRWLNFILDFQRVNRRMHSKSFIADNQAAILGGRNVGDEYFGANAEFLFSDLDAIAVGPVVRDVSQAFDLFWNSDFAYPVSQLLPKADKTALDALDERAEKIMTSTEAREFVQAMNDSSLITELLEGRMALEWAPTRMLTDQPDKIMDTTDATSGVASQLNDLLQQAKSHIELISSYFVPTKTGSRRLRRLANKGVRIRILTNSLASTDVAAVHAGYAKRRRKLLKSGIQLYEMRPLQDTPQHSQSVLQRLRSKHAKSANQPAFKSWSWGFKSPHNGRGPFRHATTSLHAKTVAVDDEWIFIGSFNFDPRSARLNTELGFVIDSPTLARQVSQAFDTSVPEVAYEVAIDDQGHLIWFLHTPEGVKTLHNEPQASVLRRAWVTFVSLLPIEWLL